MVALAFLLLCIGVSFSLVYVVPSDYDEYRQKADTVYDMVFNRMCSTTTVSGENVLLCNNLPSGVRGRPVPYSLMQGNTSVEVIVNLRGIDRVVFCADYSNPSTCNSYRIDDYTSLRLEIVPFDQLSTHQIAKPQCDIAGTESVAYLTYSSCSLNDAFIDNGTHWTLNSSCFPANMNIPVLVFCSTWSK